jgi:hypothetical protein
MMKFDIRGDKDDGWTAREESFANGEVITFLLPIYCRVGRRAYTSSFNKLSHEAIRVVQL